MRTHTDIRYMLYDWAVFGMEPVQQISSIRYIIIDLHTMLWLTNEMVWIRTHVWIETIPPTTGSGWAGVMSKWRIWWVITKMTESLFFKICEKSLLANRKESKSWLYPIGSFKWLRLWMNKYCRHRATDSILLSCIFWLTCKWTIG